MDVLLKTVIEHEVGERRVALEVNAGRRGPLLLATKKEGGAFLRLVLDGYNEGQLFGSGIGVDSLLLRYEFKQELEACK